jgi:hypothetical protein
MEREVFKANIVNKIKTRVLGSITFSRKLFFSEIQNIVQPDKQQITI